VVSSPIAGRVAQVLVEEGDHVEAGAVLAVIEDPQLPAGTAEARAAVAAAQATKAAADLELARQERLVASGIGARRELDDARAKAAAAAAELDGASARSGLATRQLARRELRAPRAGTVLHVWRRVGEGVDGTTATPVAEVADLTILELHAQAPLAALAPLREGMLATVDATGLATPLYGTVIRVAPAVDPATMLGTVRLRVTALGPLATAGPLSNSLKIGGAAGARIVIARRPGIQIPADALRRSLVGTDEVVVCGDDAKAHVHEVAIGQRSERGVELTEGLKAGERYVADHVLGLEDGQALEIAGATPGSTAAPGSATAR
jgi:RND family efflux transporter MFP subunit